MRRCYWVALALTVGAIGIFLALPTPVDPVVISLDGGPPEFTGPLAVNDLLSKARTSLKDEIQGPEAFAATGGYVYTGLRDGRIIRFHRNDHTSYETIVTCSQGDCGRPLGMYFHPQDKNTLYVADAYKGLLSIDLETRRVHTLVDARHPGKGISPMMLVDDLVVLSNGSIFFTDMSKKFSVDDVDAEVAEGRPNGRLFHYNPSDGSLHTVLGDLHAANGVCIGPNEEFLLVAETTRARLIRYYLKGPKVGTFDTFVHNLPGLPDNITPSSGGGYWVAFAALRDNPVLDMVAGLPWIRALVYKSKLTELIKALVQKHGMIIELDASGRIVRSLHDPKGVVATSTSSVLDLGDTLIVGSYYARHIVALHNFKK